ncbi:XRE family transcriptional regulator [Falsarthrobacter nasiphocae]|uniref:Uncharacterized protein n=1 Tax=Falsarthrobacter nasiphocae TaxID=189863 RepID=A0AAE3YH12_9MICC|nr:hypothetical protein [Falsarthrobacter nasiphocae]
MSKPIQYWSRTDVATYLGVLPSSLGRYKLPEPDVLVGTARGWLPERIRAWDQTRPRASRRSERPEHPSDSSPAA